MDETEAIVLVSEIAQKVRGSSLWFPDRVGLRWNALSVGVFGHAYPFVGEMKAYLEVVIHRLVDLDGHADTFVGFGLIVRAGNVVIELGLCLELVGLIERHGQSCGCGKLGLAQADIEVAVRVS